MIEKLIVVPAFIVGVFSIFLAYGSCGGDTLCLNLKCPVNWMRFSGIVLVVFGVIYLIN